MKIDTKNKWIEKPSPKALKQGSGWFAQMNKCYTYNGKYAAMTREIKTEWGKAVKRDTEIFSESYPVWDRGWSKQGRKGVCVHRRLKTNRLKHDFVFTSRLEASERMGR